MITVSHMSMCVLPFTLTVTGGYGKTASEAIHLSRNVGVGWGGAHCRGCFLAESQVLHREGSTLPGSSLPLGLTSLTCTVVGHLHVSPVGVFFLPGKSAKWPPRVSRNVPCPQRTGLSGDPKAAAGLDSLAGWPVN